MGAPVSQNRTVTLARTSRRRRHRRTAAHLWEGLFVDEDSVNAGDQGWPIAAQVCPCAGSRPTFRELHPSGGTSQSASVGPLRDCVIRPECMPAASGVQERRKVTFAVKAAQESRLADSGGQFAEPNLGRDFSGSRATPGGTLRRTRRGASLESALRRGLYWSAPSCLAKRTV